MAIELTAAEQRAIVSLQRLAKRWPKSLMLFGGSSGLTVRKPEPGKLYDASYIVATISGIRADGGDGGVEYSEKETRPSADCEYCKGARYLSSYNHNGDAYRVPCSACNAMNESPTANRGVK